MRPCSEQACWAACLLCGRCPSGLETALGLRRKLLWRNNQSLLFHPFSVEVVFLSQIAHWQAVLWGCSSGNALPCAGWPCAVLSRSTLIAAHLPVYAKALLNALLFLISLYKFWAQLCVGGEGRLSRVRCGIWVTLQGCRGGMLGISPSSGSVALSLQEALDACGCHSTGTSLTAACAPSYILLQHSWLLVLKYNYCGFYSTLGQDKVEWKPVRQMALPLLFREDFKVLF